MPSRRPVFALLLLISLLSGFGALAAPPAPAAAQSEHESVVDDFEGALASGFDGNGIPIGFFTAQDSGSTTVFQTTGAPPAPVPDLPPPNNVLKIDFTVTAFGVVIHGFENPAVDTWITQDWSTYEGLAFWLHGNNSGTDLFVDLIDNRNPASTRDDAERFTVSFKDDFSGWKHFAFPFSSFVRKEIGNGAPNDGLTLTEVHGWAFGALTTTGTQTYYLDHATIYGTAQERPLEVGFTADAYSTQEGRAGRVTVKLSKAATDPVTVAYTTAPGAATIGRDYTPAAGTLTFAPGVTQQSFTIPTLEDTKYEGNEVVILRLANPVNATLGFLVQSRLTIRDNDPYDALLLDDFERFPYQFRSTANLSLATREIPAGSASALPGQGPYEQVLQVTRNGAARPGNFIRRFPLGQDWGGAEGLSFWFYGNNTGASYKLRLLDNQAPDPGPSGWRLVWRDEFNGPSGTSPDPATWSYEIGDGTGNGNPGWGNSELEYYTTDTANAAMDGQGNLVITAREVDETSGLECYYGPCKYTSARLLTQHKAEFAFGRIESRIRVPRGSGLWPAFWSLGTDIGEVNWPQSGEIDFMEHVARLPKRVFGTIHGPGYSGGASFGGTYDFAADVADDYHTFAVDWSPGRIVWTVDGIVYHTATPANVAPNRWAFDHPFFLLLNLAVGGNFGGAVGPDTVFPQSMAVDYVRVFQAPDTAERFDATFADNFSGWRRVTVPFTTFTRSQDQPAGAPNDGLNLTSVWGYGFETPAGQRTTLLLDQVRVKPVCSYDITVTSTADSGPGSLRQALADVCAEGTISFAPSLAGATITLTSAELTVRRTLTIDGALAPGLTISGGDALRVFVIDPQARATISHLTIAHGYGWDLAGGILNNGTLTLRQALVANNHVATNAGDFWKGGGGIYNGDGSTLNLIDSTIRDNATTLVDGGGIFSFFNSLTAISGSTISGNTGGNVGGGLRILGDATIVNSTISGNQSLGWHGGAIFQTDGVMSITNSTITGNSSPGGTAGGAFVGTFTDGSAGLTLTNSIMAGNSGDQCFAGRFGGGAVTLISLGHNIGSDASCALTTGGDHPNTSPLLGPLADNGGPTYTHALLTSSPALDAGDAAVCPPTDQRGVSRPQGSGCDIGAFELAAPALRARPILTR